MTARFLLSEVPFHSDENWELNIDKFPDSPCGRLPSNEGRNDRTSSPHHVGLPGHSSPASSDRNGYWNPENGGGNSRRGCARRGDGSAGVGDGAQYGIGSFEHCGNRCGRTLSIGECTSGPVLHHGGTRRLSYFLSRDSGHHCRTCRSGEARRCHHRNRFRDELHCGSSSGFVPRFWRHRHAVLLNPSYHQS